MHDFLIGFVFVAMVACPVLIASWPRAAKDEEK
jgi:hypothetical protein